MENEKINNVEISSSNNLNSSEKYLTRLEGPWLNTIRPSEVSTSKQFEQLGDDIDFTDSFDISTLAKSKAYGNNLSERDNLKLESYYQQFIPSESSVISSSIRPEQQRMSS